MDDTQACWVVVVDVRGNKGMGLTFEFLEFSRGSIDHHLRLFSG